MSFKDIAPVYDRFNDLSVYEYWLDFTLSSLDHEPESVLDLACGTGWFSQLLAPFVGQVTGVDIDEGMLEVARQELGQVGKVSFLAGDMTALDLASDQYDLVVCFLDSLCFLESLDQVQKALAEAYRVLKPGGCFLFDVWTPDYLLEAFSDFSYFDQDESAALLWESTSDYWEDSPGAVQAVHHLTVYEKMAGSPYYQRLQADLRERTYPLTAYLEAMIQAGFDQEALQILVDYGQTPYQGQASDRWFVRAYK
ncbi:class I SAM-dependent methyltransferase [Hutsoniella sourekii]|uniref:class I SAM-dependent methyltransferase n=1 Tax=Hutsoniella sourekii TaxID=87650 RepID=UPI00047FFFA0|nr:class I SAM-dependent methyltransferase [Hutsoniella sourekii]